MTDITDYNKLIEENESLKKKVEELEPFLTRESHIPNDYQTGRKITIR
jgi:hypothetical protein